MKNYASWENCDSRAWWILTQFLNLTNSLYIKDGLISTDFQFILNWLPLENRTLENQTEDYHENSETHSIFQPPL